MKLLLYRNSQNVKLCQLHRYSLSPFAVPVAAVQYLFTFLFPAPSLLIRESSNYVSKSRGR